MHAFLLKPFNTLLGSVYFFSHRLLPQWASVSKGWRLRFSDNYRVQPLNGHRQGNGRWSLNIGWCILNNYFHCQVNSIVNISHVKTIIINVCLNVFITLCLLVCTFICHRLFQSKDILSVLYLRWAFNRGEDNRKTLIEKTKRWPAAAQLSWPFDRGFIYSILLTMNLRL